jgi:dolichyl-phosphate beta-glucosyltransferase
MILSIIIPAFDEQRKIDRDVHAATSFLLSHHIPGEIIVVDDGSTDGTAETAQRCIVPAGAPMKIITTDRHRGKGFAVRTGILASEGEYVMFADSGVTVPFENALRGLQMLKDGKCDLAHGSRRLPGSVIRRDQDWDRKLMSRVFHMATMRVMHLPSHLTDTQCGFKMYRGKTARELYARCNIDGFIFDIEVIMRAQEEGLRILEFPIEWSCDRDSRIRFGASSGPIFHDFLALRRRLLKHS